MSSNSQDIAIKVSGLSKCYQIYDKPNDRLKQFIIPRLEYVLGIPPKNYYREFWALQDISFEIKKGEAVGILGRNGSGKSTLLQLICGTLFPTMGTVQAHGRIAALLELGSGFNPEFSGRENVYLNGALLGLNYSQINDRFDAIASFADIGRFIEQPVKTYSSGMLLRLAFAVQVQLEPDILIVDEALAVGDALFQKRCFQRIEKLVSDGTTLLFVSHDQESIRTLTSKALLLKQGKLLAWGKSSDAVLEYRRLLHEEETAYFTDIAKKIAISSTKKEDSENNNLNISTESLQSRSQSLSFGDREAQILKVQIFNQANEECSVFYPGDQLKISITCQSFITTDKLNIGLRIRSKEGIKVYSWGTLNQDMNNKIHNIKPLFWHKKIFANEVFVVDFTCENPLGVNLYEIQASISYEDTPDYMSQRILHWVDEAAFFQVLMRRNEYFFGGVLDMKMTARW